MVITPSSVDRGACIELFSQYPSEKEFLYVPMSFLQPVGGPNDAYLVQSSQGFVCAYPVRINSNLKSETVEQLVSKKKDSHIASFSAAIDDIRHDIQAEATARNAAARLLRDRTRHQKDTGLGGVEGQGDWSVADVLGCIMKQCYAALERHRALPPAEFVDEGMFRLLVTDLLNTKQFAKEKLRLWLQDENQLVVFWCSYTLRDAHRLWLGLVRGRMQAAQSCRLGDAASAALLLLQVKGRVRSCVADCNLDGEPLFVEAGGDGWDEEDVILFASFILYWSANPPPQVLALAQAGCDLRAVNCMGHSGLSQAAAYGNTATLSAMLEVGADVAQYSPGKGMGALFRASYNGHVACVRALIHHKADMNAALADGTTCCYVAAEKGHTELLRFLIQSGVAVDKPDNNSVTPLWRAAERGVTECVEILINARADAEALDKDAKSALRAAACNGHHRIVELLQAAGANTGLGTEGGRSV